MSTEMQPTHGVLDELGNNDCECSHNYLWLHNFNYTRSNIMSEYNWCHGPKCHERTTTDRVRGVKGHKVLRTRKIKETSWNAGNMWSHFCSQGCWNDFMHKHWNQFIGLHPRTEPLETEIEDPKKEESQYGWSHWNIEVRQS